MTGENAQRLTGTPAYPHPSPRQPSSPAQQQQHQQHQQQQPHHHQSPLAQLSPSTVKASPQQTPGPLDAIGGSAEPSAKRGMRSQIACARCRRSKTKCVNAGQGTTCEACANTKRDCIWDHAAAATITGPLRRDSTADLDVSHVMLLSSPSIDTSRCAVWCFEQAWQRHKYRGIQYAPCC